MKALFLALGISLMAQEKIPYPFPSYGSDLIAKEIVNGTYVASINMMIKNSKTGEERYVYVPSSPDVIEKMQSGEQITEVREESLDTEYSHYDKNKSLEDAVLPVYVDADNKEPTIISRAMCPTGLTYVDELKESSPTPYTARYDDGTEKFLVIAKNYDKSSAIYKIDGMEKTELVSIPKEKDTNSAIISWLCSVGGRNFFSDGISVHEYSGGGYQKVFTSSLVSEKGVARQRIVRDKDDFYLVFTFADSIFLENIDTGEVLSIIANSNIGEPLVQNSAYGDNCFTLRNGTTIMVKDGVLTEVKKGWHKSMLKYRYDYDLSKINLRKYGVPHYPKAKPPIGIHSGTDYIGIKEGYVFARLNGGETHRIYYTTDYINYIDTEVEAFVDWIVITEKFIYFGGSSITVMSVDGWTYKAPDGRYSEQFLRNGLSNNKFEKPYIGD